MSIKCRLASLSPYYQNTILQCRKASAAANNTIQGGEVITFNTRLTAGLLFPLGHFPAACLFRPFQNAKSKQTEKGSDVCVRNAQAVKSLYS